MAAYYLIEQTLTEVRLLQLDCARQLWDIATLMRKQQRNINIAKVASNSAGALGGGMSLAGLFLVPLTAGLSIGLLIAGGVTGIASAGANICTEIAESTVIGSRTEEAQAVLDQLSRTTERLLNQLRPILENAGIPWSSFLFGLGTKTVGIWMGLRGLCDNVRTAIKISQATIEAEKTLASIAGRAPSRLVSRLIAKAGLKPDLYLPAMGVLSGIGCLLSLKDIISNSIDIYNDVSKVADTFGNVAGKLEIR